MLNLTLLKMMYVCLFFLGIKTDYSEKFQMSSDGQHLYFPSKEHIVLYNLETRERKAILRHNHDVASVRSADMTRYVTVNGNNGICIWNTANKELTSQREGFIGTSVRFLRIYCCIYKHKTLHMFKFLIHLNPLKL